MALSSHRIWEEGSSSPTCLGRIQFPHLRLFSPPQEAEQQSRRHSSLCSQLGDCPLQAPSSSGVTPCPTHTPSFNQDQASREGGKGCEGGMPGAADTSQMPGGCEGAPDCRESRSGARSTVPWVAGRGSHFPGISVFASSGTVGPDLLN